MATPATSKKFLAKPTRAVNAAGRTERGQEHHGAHAGGRRRPVDAMAEGLEPLGVAVHREITGLGVWFRVGLGWWRSR